MHQKRGIVYQKTRRFAFKTMDFAVEKDPVTYNILTTLWSDMRRPEQCLALRGEMDAVGVEPDAVTYRAWTTVAIRCALRGREVEKSGAFVLDLPSVSLYFYSVSLYFPLFPSISTLFYSIDYQER